VLDCRFEEEDSMTKLQKDHLMILLESIDSKVQITMESVSALDNKIDAVRVELKDDIAILDCKIMGLSARVDAVDKKIDAVDKKVDAVYEELVAHRNDTEAHRRPTKRSSLKKPHETKGVSRKLVLKKNWYYLSHIQEIGRNL
jgi:transcription elongation factor Elf1